MAVAVGVAKKLAIKKESEWGEAAGASGAKYLRRVTSDLSLDKQTYQSNEIRTDYMEGDFRHGVRSVAGTISGELSAGTYSELIAASLRKDFASGGATTGQTTIAASLSAPHFTRSAGSFITDGHRVGRIVRFTGWASPAAANNNKNFLITALTATQMTGVFLDGSAVSAKTSGDSISISTPGKVTWTPESGHTDDSFSIEHWYSDIAQSELFLGCKVSQITIGLPPTGMATFAAQMMGKDMVGATSQYFSSPAAVTTTGVMAAVNGALFIAGQPVALLTGLNMTINGNMSAEPVVGSNVYPDIFEGSVILNGQATVFFQDAVMRDYFVNETEVDIAAAFTTGNAGTADAVAFYLSRVKMGGARKDDGQKGLVQTMPFKPLVASNTQSGAVEKTVLQVQDTAVV